MTKEEIKRVRQELGMSQQAFAQALGTAKARVSDWERGRHKITKPFVLLIEHLQSAIRDE